MEEINVFEINGDDDDDDIKCHSKVNHDSIYFAISIYQQSVLFVTFPFSVRFLDRIIYISNYLS